MNKVIPMMLWLFASMTPVTCGTTVSSLSSLSSEKPSAIRTNTVTSGLLDMDVWQGPQSYSQFGLTYLSSVLIQNVAVNGSEVPDGAVIQLWTPSISVTGIPSKIIGKCQIDNGRCVLGIEYPISQQISITGQYAAAFYLPSYNVAMGYSWRWKGCR